MKKKRERLPLGMKVDRRVGRYGGYTPVRSPGPLPESFFRLYRQIIDHQRRREEAIYRREARLYRLRNGLPDPVDGPEAE